MIAVERRPSLDDRSVLAGVGSGLITYVVMNLVVVPIRFGRWPPTPVSIVTQLFCHIVLVGIPMALVAQRQSS